MKYLMFIIYVIFMIVFMLPLCLILDVVNEIIEVGSVIKADFIKNVLGKEYIQLD